MCDYFLLCLNEPTGSVPHPVLGDVPTCQRCADHLNLPTFRPYCVYESCPDYPAYQCDEGRYSYFCRNCSDEARFDDHINHEIDNYREGN